VRRGRPCRPTMQAIRYSQHLLLSTSQCFTSRIAVYPRGWRGHASQFDYSLSSLVDHGSLRSNEWGLTHRSLHIQWEQWRRILNRSNAWESIYIFLLGRWLRVRVER